MIKNWTMYLPIGAAVILMLGAGYVQGVWSERWGTFPELKAFGDQLAAVPTQVGDWTGTDLEGTDQKVLEIAGATGELVRVYKNPNGDQVQVSLICGRLQDLTYHTPDRCYPAAGFEMQGEPQREVVLLPNGEEAAFFAVNFTKSETTGRHAERGYWTFTGDGNWQAPDSTKFTFAAQREALYKLYVFAAIPSDPKRGSEPDFAKEFLQAFIPVLNEALRPAFERVGRISSENTAAAEEEATDAAAPPEA